jgi:hypothetical protein
MAGPGNYRSKIGRRAHVEKMAALAILARMKERKK